MQKGVILCIFIDDVIQFIGHCLIPLDAYDILEDSAPAQQRSRKLHRILQIYNNYCQKKRSCQALLIFILKKISSGKVNNSKK